MVNKKQNAKESCKDAYCPLHGKLNLNLRRSFTGKVLSDKMQKTVTVGWAKYFYVPKYERYEKRRSKLKAHNPPCINAKQGDKVKIISCRPLSKTKSFVVVEVIK